MHVWDSCVGIKIVEAPNVHYRRVGPLMRGVGIPRHLREMPPNIDGHFPATLGHTTKLVEEAAQDWIFSIKSHQPHPILRQDGGVVRWQA